MEFVKVTVIRPDNRRYSAKVDKDADEEDLLSDLIDNVGLPRVSKDGKTEIKYGINLLGGPRIKEGITLQIYEIRPPTVTDAKPLD